MPLIMLTLLLLATSGLSADVSYTPGSVKPWTPTWSTLGEYTDEDRERERRMHQGRTDKIKPRLRISGEITDQDVERFRELLVKAKANADSLGIKGGFGLLPVEVELNSHGGSLSAAMSLGRIIRKERVGNVSVRHNGECLSSCVLILGAGLQRSLGANNVGIHRPYLDAVHITTNEGQKKFYAELEMEVKAYLNEINVPTALYDKMMRIPPGRVRHLSHEELEDYNLIGFDPFHEEAWTAKEAEELGMTKSNYLEYQRNTHNTAFECGAAVGSGDILPEDFWNCVGDKLKELQDLYRQK